MATYHYLIGSVGEFDNLEAMFEVNSDTKLEASVILDRMYDALANAGFARIPPDEFGRHGLSVKERCVCSFRGSEFELGADLVEKQDVDRALSQIGPAEVVVATFRMSHSSGTNYDLRLLAVPKGSRLPEKSRGYHKPAFDQDVNWMYGADSNSEETVYLPGGTKIWKDGQWLPSSSLEYYY